MMSTEKKRSKGSILVKMLIGICLPVAAVFVISLLIILNTTKKPVADLTNSVLTARSQAASAQVGEYFARYLEVARQMATNVEFEQLLKDTPKGRNITETEGFDRIYKTLVNVQSTDKDNIVTAWTADFDSSQFTQSDGFTSDASYDVTTRQWYKDVQAAKATIITEPYIDTASKKIIVSAVSPVYDSDTEQMIGITGIDFSIDKLQSMMKSYTLGNNGFFMLISSSGTLIYYPDANYLEKNVSDTDMSDNVKNAVKNKQTGELTYTALGKTIHGYLSRDDKTGFMVVSGLPHSEYAGTVTAMGASIETVYAIATVVLIVLILLISMSIIRPIKKLKTAANQIADGHLDIAVNIWSQDEVGQVAEAFGRTVNRLKDYINYIGEVSSVMDRMAGGDLVFELKYDYTGEFAKLKTSLLNIQATLSEQVGQITIAADQVFEGSGQVAQGSQALAQGATEQASSIEELSATVIEIAGQIEKNAQESKLASKKAEESGGEILRSDDQMKKMIAAMTEIKNTSDKIGTIINTIDSIAFQTNILALNAAVEAARAGSAGKGFAVVASEVKSLASKSSESAKNTAELISSSLKAISDGMTIALQTEQALLGAVESSKNTVELIDHISAVSVQQSASIEQIKTALEQISAVVQNTSATAEESAAASQELSSQSTILRRLVSQFNVGNGGTTVKTLSSEKPDTAMLSDKY